MLVCASCGQRNPEGFRFCGACGGVLSSPSPLREVRKTVTVLFCDVAGSTALGERIDPEAMRRLMRRYFSEIESVVRAHGGVVEKFIGDAVMAVFGIPVAHEDDALRAVRAAAEIRDRLSRLSGELGVALTFRTGVNTGEVVVGEAQTLATGDAVNVAARLEQAADPGEIVIGAETRRLVRGAVEVGPLERLAVKGKSAPVEAYRLRRVDPRAPAFARRLDVPFVGRERELALLGQAFEHVDGDRACHLFTFLGAAGVGKSRLVGQFVAGLQERARTLRGQCLHYGEGITFWPIVEILKQVGSEGDAALERLVEGAVASPQELFWDVRRLLERLCAERPLIVVLDDLHWAEPMLLDLIDHVADLARDAPILLLCLARPELLEERPGWGGGKLNATTVLLEPLSITEAERLLDALGDGGDDTVRRRVVEVAEGNPLFLEEVAAFVRENGDVLVPSTIQALLQARLDRLGAEERAVIERGAVEGRVFHSRSVVELAPDELRATVQTQLASLVRKELIRPERPQVGDDDAFRFRHLLIRDAAYEALPKEMRADLHERFAGWLERHGASLVELDEILGYHLEQAARYRGELGMRNEGLERRAVGHLVAGGRKASGRTDFRAADKLLSRALALLPHGDPLRAEAILELPTVLSVLGDFDRAHALLDELEQDPDPLRSAHARVHRVLVRAQDDPETVFRDAQAVIEDVTPLFEAADDARGLAHVAFLRFNLCWFRAQAAPAAEALWAVIAHAERAGDRQLAAHASAMACGPLMFGPIPFAEAERELDARLQRARPTRLLEASVALVRATAAARRGRIDEARVLATDACAALIETGNVVIAHSAAQLQAEIEEAAGRPDEAERTLRQASDALARLGERGYRSTVVAYLADLRYRMGDPSEAESLAVEAEELGGADDISNFVIGRATRAEIAAERGDVEAAHTLAADALDFAFSTDFPELHVRALVASAHAQRAQGRNGEAANTLQRALRTAEAKGDLVAADRVSALLENTRGATTS